MKRCSNIGDRPREATQHLRPSILGLLREHIVSYGGSWKGQKTCSPVSRGVTASYQKLRRKRWTHASDPVVSSALNN